MLTKLELPHIEDRVGDQVWTQTSARALDEAEGQVWLHIRAQVWLAVFALAWEQIRRDDSGNAY